MVVTQSARVVEAVTAAVGDDRGDLEIVGVEPFHGYGTLPAELVDCRIGGQTIRLFCKHTQGEPGAPGLGRGGLDYEGRVYRDILCSLALPLPRFFGLHVDERDGTVWLILEHLTEATTLDLSEASETVLVEAASWAGRFQRATKDVGRSRDLLVYDADYYAGWARRTAIFSEPVHSDRPWLQPLCARWAELAQEMAAISPVVIHGEYYPMNILYRDGVVYPIDWETGALGLGEIDLAFLTERWSPQVADACERAYASSRWPDEPPAGLRRRLDIARAYALFRWLGERRDWTLHPNSSERFDRLVTIAERLELV